MPTGPLPDYAEPRAGPPAEDPVIEGLRGLAALAVLGLHHAAQFVNPPPGLWQLAACGVDLFFVLSGFVFGRYLQRSRFSIRAHLVRRFFRLYPLYLVALALYIALKPEPDRWRFALEHALMLHGFAGLEALTFYNSVFWSLPPEVGYYLLLPVLAGLAAVAGLWVVVGLALLLAGGIVWTGSGHGPFEPWRLMLTINTPGVLIEFMLGSLAALAAQHPRAQQRAVRVAAALLGALWAAALAGWYLDYLTHPPATPINLIGGRRLLSLFSVAFALWVFALCARPSSEALAAGGEPARAGVPLVSPARGLARWAGRLSYGVYLFHPAAASLLLLAAPQAKGWAGMAAALLLTLILAWAGHLSVERPLRQWGRRWAQRWERPAH